MDKRKTGMSAKLIKKYEFEDHIWAQNKSDPANLNYLAMANSCVKVGSEYAMRKKSTGQWEAFKQLTDAKKEAVNTWLNARLPTGDQVSWEMINEFFDGIKREDVSVGKKTVKVDVPVGSCPNIFERLVCPLGPSFITYNNHHYLNEWYDDMAVPQEQALPVGKMVLLLVYGSLCNGTVDKENISAEADRVYQMVVDNKYDNLEFRFLINWLAANYQEPGINLLTNVWLLGEQEGLGKGTIVEIMGYVLGKWFVGKLNQTEIEAGWNDHLVGKQIVEINEFDTAGKMTAKAWNAWIKGHTIEPHLKVRKRNTTSFQVPNIANYIFTGNVVNQEIADKNDRRNQFIQTTSDPFWITYATNLQLSYFKPNPEQVASGFAVILDKVQIDHSFISRSFKNDIRDNITSFNETIIEAWLDNDPTVSKNSWVNSAVLYEEFKTWWIRANPSDKIPSLTSWGKAMRADARVADKRSSTGVQYQISSQPLAVLLPPKIEEVSAMVNTITGNKEIVYIEDNDKQAAPPVDFSKLSKLEKIRLALLKEDSEH